MFEQSFVNRDRPPVRKASIAASFLLQVAMLLALVALPMVFVEDLPAVVLAATLQAPDPPAPQIPKHVPAAAARTRVIRQFEADRLLEPRAIPDRVALIVDEPPLPFTGPTGAANPQVIGIPGGNSMIGDLLAPIAPPKPQPVEPPEIQRYRVGGQVEPPSQLNATQPVYPRMAIQTGTQGEVRIEAIIGVDGRVRDVKALSGHPLLVPAAKEAVRRWIYQPTTLNGVPVEVVMVVTVNFRLTR